MEFLLNLRQVNKLFHRKIHPKILYMYNVYLTCMINNYHQGGASICSRLKQLLVWCQVSEQYKNSATRGLFHVVNVLCY